ncbi:MAG: FAD-dependent oxidoreductase [Burkholderiales bacterium]
MGSLATPLFDVLVVGGGLAGLTAANRCAESGLKVAVLERGAEERYPCNSRIAGGFLNCGYRYNIRETPQVLRHAIEEQTRGFADTALAEVFSHHAGFAVDWLSAQGIRIVTVYVDGDKRRAVLAPPPPNRPGLIWEGRGTDTMVRKLLAKLEERGGRLIRDTRAGELLVEKGRCVGVGATQAGNPIGFNAKAIVLADGGYQANLDLLKQYVSPAPERLLQRNAKSGSGDGLRMALKIGAQVRGMGRFYGHVQSIDALTNALLWPHPVLDATLTAGIVVDQNGKRFADEGLGGIFFANAIAQQNDPLGTVAIFDDTTWQGRARMFARPPNPFAVRVGATCHIAQTIAELAALAGLPAAALEQSVSQFNQAITQAATDKLDPPRSSSPFKPVAITKPPFYAMPLCAGITYTMGGIAIDAQCRVLHENGNPIEGLFAAGSTTGGHEGGPVAGYTGGLSKALTFGWLAAGSIVAQLK